MQPGSMVVVRGEAPCILHMPLSAIVNTWMHCKNLGNGHQSIGVHISSNVGIATINHPFFDGLYPLFMVMNGGWFIIAIPTVYGLEGFPLWDDDGTRPAAAR